MKYIMKKEYYPETLNYIYAKSNISIKTHKTKSIFHQDPTLYWDHYFLQGESLSHNWLEEFYVSKQGQEKLSFHLL